MIPQFLIHDAPADIFLLHFGEIKRTFYEHDMRADGLFDGLYVSGVVMDMIFWMAFWPVY